MHSYIHTVIIHTHLMGLSLQAPLKKPSGTTNTYLLLFPLFFSPNPSFPFSPLHLIPILYPSNCCFRSFVGCLTFPFVHCFVGYVDIQYLHELAHYMCVYVYMYCMYVCMYTWMYIYRYVNMHCLSYRPHSWPVTQTGYAIKIKFNFNSIQIQLSDPASESLHVCRCYSQGDPWYLT